MNQLVARVHRIPRLYGFPDALLLHLLSSSDFVPDRVASGVILFQQGELVTYWYLLLSGEVELYLSSSKNNVDYSGDHVETLKEGAIFGELSLYHHSCSGLVKRSSEFVRISQHHFLNLYNKHADHLQPYLTVMGDLEQPTPTSAFTPVSKKSLTTIKEESNDQNAMKPPSSNATKPVKSEPDSFASPSSSMPQINGMPSSSSGYKNTFDFLRMKRELPSMPANTYPTPSSFAAPKNSRHTTTNGQLNEPSTSSGLHNLHTTIENNDIKEWKPPVNLFELSNSLSLESRIYEAGLILKRVMQLRTPGLIKERHNKIEVFSNAMSGSEMTAWLNDRAIDCLVNTAKPLTNLQLTGIWQTLLDHHIISHVTNEQQFKDKFMFYRWTLNDPFEDYYEYRAQHPGMQFMTESNVVNQVEDPPVGAEPPTLNDLHNAIFFLTTVAPDSLFRIILSKPVYEKTPEELELVYEELLHVKALANMSSIVKRELASVIRFEEHQNVGTVLFHQGDQGKNWYIILKGSVDVSIAGKGIVCTLQEGDDFGKLALVNESPRAATITVSTKNSQFLQVDKFDFNRILRGVEENTVRLKEHGQDVLVLERIDVRFQDGQTTPCNQCCYSVMAGIPDKMIEYVLETRVDAQTDENSLDIFLEDFILTHIIYMPSNVLCNYLKTYYAKRGDMDTPTSSSQMVHFADNEFNLQERLTAKRRVIAFLGIWQYVLGIHFFFDPVANSFVEEMLCCVLEDSKTIPNMNKVLDQIMQIHHTRENAMRFLSRHPATVLDGGFYASEAPAPNPILPIDTCRQCIYLSDGTYTTISIRLDKTAKDIARIACAKLRGVEPVEECFLIEVKSSGERVVYSPTEVSVPTMISLNGRLFTVYKDEIDTLTPLLDQHGPTEPLYNSIFDVLSSSGISQQLLLYHTNLFEAVDEIELVFQVVGRDKFSGRIPSNLDILLRRFNEIQFWTTTEILLAPNLSKRVTVLKKFIKIALYSKENKDLMSLFAITLGLSNVSVSRLTHLWDKLPGKLRRQFAEFEALLDPSRNHRAYRMLVAKMQPPIIPFIPLLLKDLTFTHEGNRTFFANKLVNFDKMHMIASVLRSFRNCKNKYATCPIPSTKKLGYSQNLIKNFPVIDDQRRLMEISYQMEPPTKMRHY